jgi:hypothetical protein
MERKKMIELIGMIFVAAIFLSSYAAFGSNAPGSGATTTVNQGQLAYAQTPSPVPAQLTGYNSTLQASVLCSNATRVSDTLTGLLANMTRNGNVTDFQPENGTITLIEAGSEGSYALYRALSSGLGPGANCTRFTTTADILLPATLKVVVTGGQGGVSVEVPSSLRHEFMPATLGSMTGNTVSVYAYMLLTSNYTIYGSLTLKPSTGA